ncbi:chemocyanin-like [Vicia villosa]|nr:chemocyanin-like [Vicia villosa]
MLLLCIFVFHPNMIHAVIFTVGDGQGWSFGIQNWPAGKTFKAGDTLVFNYAPSLHNVVKVSEADFNACVSKPLSGTRIFTSGADRIVLVKGTNFFLCGVPGHCGAGQKIAVNAI